MKNHGRGWGVCYGGGSSERLVTSNRLLSLPVAALDLGSGYIHIQNPKSFVRRQKEKGFETETEGLLAVMRWE